MLAGAFSFDAYLKSRTCGAHGSVFTDVIDFTSDNPELKKSEN
jgi:hypothetical protein